MIQLIDQFLLLLSATIRFLQPDDTVREVLAKAQQRLMVLRHRGISLDKPFVVAFVGQSNVGKSTLMNALLGDEYAPVGNYPCTACPIEFMFGELPQLTVYSANDYYRPQWVCSNAGELLNRLMAVADEKQRTFGEKVSRVEVMAPLPILKDRLVLADTPGFNAVQLSNCEETDEKVLEDYLRTRTSQVFWIVRATFGIGRAENGFFDRFLGELCDDIVVTGSELLDEAQRQRWHKRFAPHLWRHVPRFHFVSGLDGTGARRSNNAVQLENSGILRLEAQLKELAVHSARIDVLQQEVLDLAKQLGRWARNHWSDTAASAGHFWNPPAWAALEAQSAGHPLCGQVIAVLSVPDHNR